MKPVHCLQPLIWVCLAYAIMASSCAAQEDTVLEIQALRRQRKFSEAKQRIIEVRKLLVARDFAKKTLLEIEWLQCETALAFEQAAESRMEAYQQINDHADRFLLSDKSNPNQILIEVQKAVTGLQFGELIRKEIEAGSSTDAKVREAFALLRDADRSFESLDKKLDVMIPGSARKTVNDELNQRQLISLQNQVRYQKVKTKINRGLLYGGSDPDNRVAILSTARNDLEKVIPLIEKVDSAWWESRLDLVRCLRAIGDFQAAQKFLVSLPLSEAPPQIQLAMRAEVIRVFLDLKDLKRAISVIGEGRQIDGQVSPEFDFAILEYYLRRRQLLPNDDQKKLQDTIVNVVKAIENQHGTYWGRRANQALIRSARSTGATGSRTLIRMAQDAYSKKQFKESIESFEKAATAAKMELNRDLELELRFQAIVIHQKQGEHAEVVAKSKKIAKEFRNTNRAAVVSLLGILSAADLVRNGIIKVDEYVQQIDYHLENWKHHPTVGKVAYFKGEYEMAQKNWFAAAFAFRKSTIAIVEIEGALDIDAYEKNVTALTRSFRSMRELPGRENQKRGFLEQFDAKSFFALIQEKTSTLESTLVCWSQFALDVDSSYLQAVGRQLKQETTLKGDLLINYIRVMLRTGQAANERDWAKKLSSMSPAEESDLLQALQFDWETSDAKIQQAMASALGHLQLDPEQVSVHWELVAHGLVKRGNAQQALNLLRQITSEQPNKLKPQQVLARTLSASSGSEMQEMAQREWRKILARAKPRSETWFEAKYEVAQSHYRLGNFKDALSMLDLVKAIPPGWENSTYSTKLDELHLKLSTKK